MNSTYLEVGIGLVVVFFVLATIADGLNEIVSRTLNTRAKTLWATLTGLLTDSTELKPDTGFLFIFKAILPSWLGGLDFRPRVHDDILSAVDRVALVDWLSKVRNDRATKPDVKAVLDEFKTGKRLQFRALLETADDESLLQLAIKIYRAVGGLDIADVYPPLQSTTVRAELAPHYYRDRYGIVPVGPPPDATALGQWLITQPLEAQLKLLAKTTASGRFVNAAARAAALLGSASIGGLDYVRRPGLRTKVFWLDGKAFGSAIWQIATERAPVNDAGGPVGVDSVAMIENLAMEWQGTPLGDYLATAGVEHAENTDGFIDEVGAWFDGQMDRLSLTYRRNVRWVLAGFGLAMAIGFNVNAIGLTEALVHDAEARSVLTAFADSTVTKACGAGGEIAGDCTAAASDVSEQLDTLRSLDDQGIPVLSSNWSWRGLEGITGWQQLLGMAVTAAAVSYGGAFWFDFLKYLTGVRRRV